VVVKGVVAQKKQSNDQQPKDLDLNTAIGPKKQCVAIAEMEFFKDQDIQGKKLAVITMQAGCLHSTPH
jgi:hypothetical protein